MKKVLFPLFLAVLVLLLFVKTDSAYAFQDKTTNKADSSVSFSDVEFTEVGTSDSAAAKPEVAPAKVDTAAKTKVAGKTNGLTDAKAKETKPLTLWETFIKGFLGGLAALLMPCIFPMLPLTVSFFTKKAGSRSKAVGQATIYGLSIIVIYVALGLLVTLAFGSDALNALSTNGIFNFVFFLLLVVFAVSFFGAFEITLPSSFVNKMDSKSDKGGLIGIFFMAFTLSLVSFSCTGPIIGTLLVDAASKGDRLGPAIGMLGFSIALAIPFTLFAMFPSWLKALPKSGGWLNSVKVVLGFLELALAMKFLSNVDLAYNWHWLDREVFLALWIVIFALMGLYLLGKLKFSHDSDVPYLSVPRLFFAIVVFSFVTYMVPGMWGAPLKSISAFLPPTATQDFNLSKGISSEGGNDSMNWSKIKDRKYAEIFHGRTVEGYDSFYDYKQSLEASKEVNKPVLIDFTGWNCVNCRKMEANVWTDPAVNKMLKNNFILAELYVDEKKDLAEADKYVSTYSKKQIKTIGAMWSDLQASRFNANSQPFYVIVNSDGTVLVPPQGADYDPASYLKFLKSGLDAFNKK